MALDLMRSQDLRGLDLYLFKPVSWASRMTRPCLSPTVASDRECFYCAFHHTSGINPIRSP